MEHFRGPGRRYLIAAAKAASSLGLEFRDLRLLSIGQYGSVALPSERLCARVGYGDDSAELLALELRIARQMCATGLPFLRPADDISPSPVVTPAGAATFWPLLR